MPEIDLLPNDYKSERKKPREPIFGSGAGPLLGELLIGSIGIGLLILVMLLGIQFKEYASRLLFGEKVITIRQIN